MLVIISCSLLQVFSSWYCVSIESRLSRYLSSNKYYATLLSTAYLHPFLFLPTLMNVIPCTCHFLNTLIIHASLWYISFRPFPIQSNMLFILYVNQFVPMYLFISHPSLTCSSSLLRPSRLCMWRAIVSCLWFGVCVCGTYTIVGPFFFTLLCR